MQVFVISLFICSVTISALALLYKAVIPLLTKRYSAAGLYYVWLVLVAGLIIPFRPQFCRAIVKVDMPGGTAVPVIRVGGGLPVIFPTSHVLPSTVPRIMWWQIAAAVWLAGMAIFLAYHIIRHYRFLKLTARWSEKITDQQALVLFQDLKSRMGISRKIGLHVCGFIGSPMMMGFARPRILLPEADFAQDELRFILQHELVHYKRKDLWYKSLVLAAAAIHWFNPVVHLMAKEIARQCELSCDAEVVRSTGADKRLSYSETIIGVVRYKSKLKTAFSTNFFGGKKDMRTRISSIMDMRRKKVGAAVFCGALVLTMGSGATLAANVEAQEPRAATKENTEITPGISVAMFPNPDIYSSYTAFGITISEDGSKLLYKGQPVRQFVDEQADSWAFYFDGSGSGNLSAVRNAAGEVTGIERLNAQKAQKYYESFFAEELDPGFFNHVGAEAQRDFAVDMAREGIWEGK